MNWILKDIQKTKKHLIFRLTSATRATLLPAPPSSLANGAVFPGREKTQISVHDLSGMNIEIGRNSQDEANAKANGPTCAIVFHVFAESKNGTKM
jgi:hypothetical protein